jgi:hypothetical protein
VFYGGQGCGKGFTAGFCRGEGGFFSHRFVTPGNNKVFKRYIIAEIEAQGKR